MTKQQESALTITSMFKATFGTPEGQKCLQHLEDTFVDRIVARPGDDLFVIGQRQGESNLIRQILKEVRDGNR